MELRTTDRHCRCGWPSGNTLLDRFLLKIYLRISFIGYPFLDGGMARVDIWIRSRRYLFFFQAEDGIRDSPEYWSSDVCSSDLS